MSDPINGLVIEAAARIVARGEVATTQRIYWELKRQVSDRKIRKIRGSLVSRGLLKTGTENLKRSGGCRKNSGPKLPDIEDRVASHADRVERELRALEEAGEEKRTNRGNSKRVIAS